MWQQTLVDSSEGMYDSTLIACIRSALPEVKTHANQLLGEINSRGNNSCRFDQIKSNQQHFQPILHSSGALYFPSLLQIDFQYDDLILGETTHVDAI